MLVVTSEALMRGMPDLFGNGQAADRLARSLQGILAGYFEDNPMISPVAPDIALMPIKRAGTVKKVVGRKP